MSRLLALGAFLLTGWGCGGAMMPASPAATDAEETAPPAAVIIVVRHAETAGDDPRDPSLGEPGMLRAAALLQAMREVGLDAVYTSQFRRTRETGAIVAEGLGVPLHVAPIAGADIADYSRALLERIDREHPGGRVLVVGHSNTAPVLVQTAAGSPAAAIDETEFDRIFILVRDESGVSVVNARY